MDLYSLAAREIIKAQELVIGPIALEQAKNVSGLTVSGLDDVRISGNAQDVLSNLVNQYSKFFGRASIEVCKDAIKEVKPPIPQQELPEILR